MSRNQNPVKIIKRARLHRSVNVINSAAAALCAFCVSSNFTDGINSVAGREVIGGGKTNARISVLVGFGFLALYWLSIRLDKQHEQLARQTATRLDAIANGELYVEDESQADSVKKIALQIMPELSELATRCADVMDKLSDKPRWAKTMISIANQWQLALTNALEQFPNDMPALMNAVKTSLQTMDKQLSQIQQVDRQQARVRKKKPSLCSRLSCCVSGLFGGDSRRVSSPAAKQPLLQPVAEQKSPA